MYPNSLLTKAKESLRLLLDHGGAYIETEDIIGPHRWVEKHLRWGNWTAESVAFLLDRSENRKLPYQNLTGCLFLAIRGSYFVNALGIRDVIVRLIKAGADVYGRDERDHTVSDVVCDPDIMWWDSVEWRLNGIWLDRDNYDLRLKRIWLEALSECGMDAEKVFADSHHSQGQHEHVFDSAFDTTSSEEEGSSMDETEYSVIEELEDGSDIGNDDIEHEERLEHEVDYGSLRVIDDSQAHHHEQFLLEGDAEVWRS